MLSRLEIRPGDLAQSVATEARIVATMDDGDGQFEQTFHCRAVVTDVRVVSVVQERAVVDRIAREQRPGRGFPQSFAGT